MIAFAQPATEQQHLTSPHDDAGCSTDASPDALDRLGDEIAELAAHLHAATHRLLVRLAEFDRREGWSGGFRSCAHWLSWRTGIDPGAAREKVRVARALEQLPALSAALARGELSYAKARALTRIATSGNEAELLEIARCGTAAHVERIVRAWRRIDRQEEAWQERERHRARHLWLHADEDGMYEIRGRLSPEVGALLARALEAGVTALYAPRARHDGGNVECTSYAQQRADALGLVAEWALSTGTAHDVAPHVADQPDAGLAAEEPSAEMAAGAITQIAAGAAREARRKRRRPMTIGRADRFQVVLHVDAEALRQDSTSGQAVLHDGRHVSAETSRRLACDASRVVMTLDSAGNALDVGRRTRTVPPAIRRALDHRDRGCRFPGCNARFCDAHHIEHWADGGVTKLHNLVLLCRRHHRAVHEEGFRVHMEADGEVQFIRPDGRRVPHVPPSPVMPPDPVATLVHAHREMHLQIDAWTPTPLWNGEPLDIDRALQSLMPRLE